MLRITRVEDPSDGLCLKLEGRLVGEWIALLEGELEGAGRGGRPLSLDLSTVDYASLEATRVLRAATDRGIRIVACSPLLAKLLGPSP